MTKFVNRGAEIASLLAELKKATPSNRVLLIEGVSGIGKSALTANLLARVKGRIAVKVENVSAVHSEGFYIKRIAKALNTSAAQDQLNTSLERFLKGLPTPEIRRRYDKSLLSSLLEIEPVGIAKPVVAMAQRRLGAGEFSEERLLRSTESEDILVLTDYVRWILSTNDSVIINIENIQVADPASLRLVGEELLSVHRGHVFLLEYTYDKSSLHDITEIEKLCQNSGSTLRRVHLKKLAFEHILDLVTERQAITLLERAYSEHSGNLREIEDLQIICSRSRSMDSYALGIELSNWTTDFTAAHIRALNKAAIFILTCIATHQGSVGIDLLHAFYEHSSQLRNIFLDIEGILEELSAQRLVRLRNNDAIISHDSIVHILLNDSGFEKFALIAFQTWAAIYGDIYAKKDFTIISRHEALFQLSRCYASFDPALLLGLSEEIKEVAVNSLYPRAALELLEKLRSAFDRSTSERSETFDRINFALLDVYYSLGLFEEGQKVLAQVKAFPERQSAYRIALLDRLEQHQEAIRLINDFLRDKHISKAYRLTLKLLLLTSYRSLNRFADCEKLWREVVNDESLRSLPEYGYALRNAEMVLPLNESLHWVKQSIEFFNNRERLLDEARSRITHAMLLVESGSLEEASDELEVAGSMLEGKTLERHIVLNDRAVILLYKASPDWSRALDLLNNALRTITTAFDKIAIYNNLILAAVLGAQHELAESIETRLLETLELQPDKVIHRITLYNLSFAAKARGDVNSEERYLRGARTCGLGEDPSEGKLGTYDHYWNARLRGESLGEGSDYNFLARFPYEAIYITYWHFSIPPLDLSSN